MKKLISLLLIFSLIFSINVYSSDFMDVNGTEYEHAVTLMESLGIVNGYEDGSFGLNRTVTRAEFSVMLARLLNLQGTSDAKYDDVPTSHWAAAEISLLSDFGAISGTGNEMFEPDATVTFEQAVKMIVIALGYDVYAEYNGGYPSGYLRAATECGLFKGVSAKTGEMTRGELVILLYNAAKTEVLERVGVGKGDTYKEKAGNTILSKYHDVYFTEGIITANYRTGINGTSTRAGEIRIEDTLYHLDEKALYVSEYLGYKVEAYYRMETPDDDKTVFYVYRKETANEVTEINSEDIVSFSGNTLVYTVDDTDRTRSIKINPSAYVTVNGQIKKSYVESDFKSDMGKVTIVTNDMSGYTFVSIRKYENYFVSDVYDEKIYNKYISSEAFELKAHNNNETFTLRNTYGREIGINEIQPNDILTVAKSQDGFLEIIYVSDRVSGTLESISEENGKTVYYIDGAAVKVSPSLKKAYLRGVENEPEIGENIIISLDAMGYAAGLISESYINGEMAFLINGMISKGIESRVELLLLTSKNKQSRAFLADKVRHIQDGVVSSVTDVEMLGLLKAGNQQVERQVVILKKNSAGEINEIETAVPKNARVNTNSFYRFDVSDKLYKSAPMSFEGITTISGDTVVFRHPDDTNRDITDGYNVTGAGAFVNDGRYTFVAYGKYDKKIPLMAVSVQMADSISDDSALFIVERTIDTLNSNGEVVKQIIGMQNGAEATAMLKDDSVLDNAVFIGTNVKTTLSEGDVIRIGRDSTNAVTNIDVVYDYDLSGDLPYGSEPAKTDIYNPYTNVMHLVYGQVSLKDEGLIKIRLSGDKEEIHKVDKVKIMMYDSTMRKGSRLRATTVNDIIDVDSPDASKVLLRSRYGEVRDLIIFK